MHVVGHGIIILRLKLYVLNIFSYKHAMGLNNYNVKKFSITKLIINPVPIAKLYLHMNFVLTLNYCSSVV
jgi:hypothetical protein